MVVGLTGGIGSGKSTVANMFAHFSDVAIYNADLEARNLMNTSPEIKEKLINEFGVEVYKNNELNRPYLANIVFKNKEKLATLNALVHPVVHKHLKDFIERNASKSYILYENAILFENKSHLFCDKIITVTAPLDTRIQRVIKRDNTSYEEVKNRIENQWNDAKKILQSHYIIQNSKLEDTEKEVFKIHNFLTRSKY